MVVDNEKWKELTGIDIIENIKAQKRQSINNWIESLSDEELETCMEAVSSAYFSRMERKSLELKEGDIIKRPGNRGTLYDLIIDVRDEYINNNDYEWVVEYAAYFVDDNGKVFYRDLRTYNLAESYKVFELCKPGVEVIHSNYEVGDYEEGLNAMMVDIFNKSICSVA